MRDRSSTRTPASGGASMRRYSRNPDGDATLPGCGAGCSWLAMPEYPDVVVYLERLQAYVGGRVLESVRLRSPFVLRSVEPPLSAVFGKRILGFERIGKRLVFVL